jgi:hypothetical protein
VNSEGSILRTAKSIRLSIVIGVLCLVHPATAATLDLRFDAQTTEFEAAAAEYRALWATDGARIAHALEIATGLVFNEDRYLRLRLSVDLGPGTIASRARKEI